MSEHHRWKPLRVTISDPDSGAVIEERVVSNDYCLITCGNRYVKSLQLMGKTHMIAVAVHKDVPLEATVDRATGLPWGPR